MRKVIGYFVSELTNLCATEKLNSIIEHAKKYDMQVVSIYLGFDWGIASEKWKFMFFEKLKGSTFDAFIFDAEQLSYFDNIQKIIEDYCEKPCICIDGYYPGCSSVYYDDEKALITALERMYEKKGARKFGFVATIDDPKLSRLSDIYGDFLENHNIERNPEYDIFGKFSKGQEMYKLDPLFKGELDVVITIDEKCGYWIRDLLDEHCPKDGKRAVVCGLNGSADYYYYENDDVYYTFFRDSNRLAEECINMLLKLFEDPTQKLFTKLDYIPCDNAKTTARQPLEDVSHELYVSNETNVAYDKRQFKMIENLFQTEESKVGDVITEYLPKHSMLVLKEAFVNNIFEADLDIPGDNSYYVVADRTALNVRKKMVNTDDLRKYLVEKATVDMAVNILPLYYLNSYYGFFLYADYVNGRQLQLLERFAMSIASYIGFYIYNKKLQFANMQLSTANKGMRQLQVRDAMTGMYNNRGFVNELNNLKEHCLITGENITLICLDLDRLKNINEIYGHSEGDVAIQNLARIITDSISSEDKCARLGSDEFVIAIHSMTDGERAADNVISAIRSRVDNYNVISGKDYSLVVNFNSYMVIPYEDTVMSDALDSALSSKRINKLNKRRALPSETEENGEIVDPLEAIKVKDIIDGNKFRYAFQPIVDAKNGKIYAYEALMRSDTKDPIMPAVILKYATKENRLYDIERATFFNVLENVKTKADQFKDRKVFLNSIPGFQIDQVDYDKLRMTYRDEFKNVIVEITEQNELMDDDLDLMLQRSTEDGFGLAVDDYGCGYSNTASLLRYLPNCVKIDRMLISEIQEDPRKQHFVKSIIDFAHDNNFLALAEGVETAEELRAVIYMNVDLIQGYYTARPSFDIIDEIPEKIKDEIIKFNSGQSGKAFKKTYIASKESELSLTHLAVANYTGIIIANSELTIAGNPDFPAALRLMMKDHSKCVLTLNNVKIESDGEKPCLDLGENTSLVLKLEGNNVFTGGGIRVPASSSIHIIGEGNLLINNSSQNHYGIGSGLKETFGKITSDMSGELTVNVEGESGICVGGGIAESGSLIALKGGRLRFNCNTINGLGVGSVNGNVNIDISYCDIGVDVNSTNGIGIGSVNSNADVKMSYLKAVVDLTGSNLNGLGSKTGEDFKLSIISANVRVHIDGQKVVYMGSISGGAKVYGESSRIELNGSGSEVVGIGSLESKGEIKFMKVGFYYSLESENAVLLGAEDKNVSIDGGGIEMLEKIANIRN